MDNDVFIPYKFRASQIVGLAKVAAKSIETAGIKLKEVSGSEPRNTIGWYNSIGNLKEAITGTSSSVEEIIHRIIVEAIGTVSSSILMVQGSDNTELNEAFVGVTIGGITKRILNQKGQSSFLQLVSLAKRTINISSVTMEYPGGTPNLNPVTVKHGLGTTPIGIFAMTDGYTNIGAGSVSGTEFTLEGARIDGFSPAKASRTVWWIAIG